MSRKLIEITAENGENRDAVLAVANTRYNANANWMS